MTTATLLVELLTEELPPKALARLGEVFAKQIHSGLSDRNLVAATGAYDWFATPRRLATSCTMATVSSVVRRGGLTPAGRSTWQTRSSLSSGTG